MARTPITKEEVAQFIKTYAGQSPDQVIKDSLKEGGTAWNADYDDGVFSICEAIAKAINQELDEEHSIIQAKIDILKNKINQLISAYNQLRSDYNNAIVPTSAPEVTLLGEV